MYRSTGKHGKAFLSTIQYCTTPATISSCNVRVQEVFLDSTARGVYNGVRRKEGFRVQEKSRLPCSKKLKI